MRLENILEGVLFAMGGSVDRDLLAETMQVDRETLDKAASALAREYEEDGRGLRLISLENNLQLSTAEGCYETLIRLVKKLFRRGRSGKLFRKKGKAKENPETTEEKS